MSAKKPLIRANTPRSDCRNLGNTPNFRQPLNKTLTRSLSNLAIDTTTCSASATQEIDWNLQCSLAYNEYLQAVMNNHIAKKTIKEYEHKLDDQLVIQAKCLQMRATVKKQFDKLMLVFGEIENLVSSHNVLENLDSYIKYVENITQRLYLKNIKLFSTQNEYDEFSSLVEQCSSTMENLRKVIDDDKISGALSENLEKFLFLKKEIELQQKLLFETLNHINFLMFQNISDKFACS
ncbi:hypothetical protein FQR65_LT10847 [Abscondita terminalis]|nr:hypothetical protein FQR65_LT10847 [Abscondita terminalis]